MTIYDSDIIMLSARGRSLAVQDIGSASLGSPAVRVPELRIGRFGDPA
jgi:hypothetical protein